MQSRDRSWSGQRNTPEPSKELEKDEDIWSTSMCTVGAGISGKYVQSGMLNRSEGSAKAAVHGSSEAEPPGSTVWQEQRPSPQDEPNGKRNQWTGNRNRCRLEEAILKRRKLDELSSYQSKI